LPTVYLGHGAAGTAASMKPYVEGLKRRGVDASAVNLKPGRSVPKAERALPLFREQVPDLLHAIIGGHSFGGRVASLLAAESPCAGLLLFSYPLHAPGKPEAWRDRTAHWARIACPVLLLSGEADPFAQIDLLRKAVRQLGKGELVTYPRVGHGLAGVLDQALDRAAAFVQAAQESAV
jgi:predicted alpha/beta-hydrolase family hydrolase